MSVEANIVKRDDNRLSGFFLILTLMMTTTAASCLLRVPLLLLFVTTCTTTTTTTTAAFTSSSAALHHVAFSSSSTSSLLRVNKNVPVVAFGRYRHVSLSLSSSSSEDDADGIGDVTSSSSNTGNDDMKRLLEELRQRTNDFTRQEQQTTRNWLQAKCKSSVGLICNDWVRRIAVSSWPLVAVGSCQGNVYIGNLESSTILASSSSSSASQEETSLLQQDDDDDDNDENSSTPLEGMDSIVRMLYGGFDGGGTIAIAFDGSLLCESGRHGGVHIWRHNPNSSKLISQGQIPCLKNTIITSLQIQQQHLDDNDNDHDYLWVGTGDGRVLSFDLNNENLPLAMQTRPIREFNLKSPILSFYISPEIGLAAIATASGAVQLVSLLDDENIGVIASFTPPFDSSVRRSANSYPLCVAFVKSSSGGDGDGQSSSSTSWSVACGGNDGSIFLQQLNMQSNSDGTCSVNLQQPLMAKSSPLVSLLPRHMAPVKCLTSHPSTNGLLMSAGQDGTIRIWNVSTLSQNSKRGGDCLLYQLMGYKVWLGSLWTDGQRLISDGSDNTIIVHDFGGESSPSSLSSQ